jgi:hypothetical protein
MGPQILFDKSTLQSLRVDEACWLDAFYLPIISPLFYVETLADLEKQVAKGRTPEQVVGNLAEKTPPNACANVHHRTLAVAELMRHFDVTMDRRPIIGGAQPLVTEDQRGVFFPPSPEMEALNRWQNGRFLELEREFARVWRRGVSGIDLDRVYQRYKCKLPTLEDARGAALRFIATSPYATLKMAFEALEIDERLQWMIINRWGRLGCPSLSSFVPYTAHVMSVDLFFNYAIGADLISRDRPTNKIDVAYLYYLPFCMIFVSNDRLHERAAKCFLRQDQLFINGQDLKSDLARLDEHYSGLPEDVKERGVISFANRPPDEGFLVTALWDRLMRPDWRQPTEIPPEALENTDLIKRLRRLKEAAKEKRFADVPYFPAEEGDFMLVEKSVPIRMGKWRLVPPEAERQPS